MLFRSRMSTHFEDSASETETRKEGGKKFSSKGRNVKEMLEKKISTLLTFPSARQLDGKNFSTWVMQMEAVLESYDLAFMVLQDVP